MVKVNISEIVFNDKLTSDIFRMRLRAPEQAKRVRAGQILHIKCGEDTDMVLRRPISVSLSNIEDGTLDIVYQVKGKGTRNLSMMKPGGFLDYMGPSGNFYELSAKHSNIAVVGGGIGVFPLLEVLSKYRKMSNDGTHVRCDTFLGFRNIDTVVLEDDFRKLSDDFTVATDDGSYGFNGLVTLPFIDAIKDVKYDIVYACGPGPMIKALSAIVDNAGIPCQVSLEQRMGCGIGACKVCVCMIRSGGEAVYKQVCKDGPVFWSRDVVFN